ncbi:archease [Saccharomonospora sp. NPDC006951]
MSLPVTGHGAGYRPAHAADLHITAWAPTRESCFAHAVVALTDSWVRTRPRTVTATARHEVRADADNDLLAGVLDGVIARIRTMGQLPVSARVSVIPGGLRVTSEVADLSAVVSSGSIPKRVSARHCRCTLVDRMWCCTARIDL